MTRLLAIDLGERRIGLAVADLGTGSVRALSTIGRRDVPGDIATLTTVVREQRVTQLVIGLPLHADGHEGIQAADTRAWSDAVAATLGLPIHWRDERLTSQAAEARVGGPGRGRSGGVPSASARRTWRGRIDADAAMSIAQRELDARSAASASPMLVEAGA